MTTEQIITLITLIAGLIGAIAALVPTLIKMFKALKEIATNKNWQAIKDIAKAAMQEVEEHSRKNPNMTSQQKLDMAINIIKEGAAAINIEVDTKLISDLVEYIEKTIKWANNMKGE